MYQTFFKKPSLWDLAILESALAQLCPVKHYSKLFGSFGRPSRLPYHNISKLNVEILSYFLLT